MPTMPQLLVLVLTVVASFNLQDFLELGYSVLLSDVDIVTLRDPFGPGLLARDADVEGMTDGFDAMTAYGWDDVMDDPKMGWSR